MSVVRFLERKWVIRAFGVGLILAPAFNVIVQLIFLQKTQQIPWEHISLSTYLQGGSAADYTLSIFSVVFGLVMLQGSRHAWKFVLGLLGTHLALQIINYKSKEWQGPIAWISFVINLAIFLFIADQLVFKIPGAKEDESQENKSKDIKSTDIKSLEPVLAPQPSALDLVPDEKISVLQLKSYKKILFSFDSDRPWGRLMTLTSHQLVVNSFAEVPETVESKVIQVRFTKDLIVDIQFDRKESQLYFFTPLNMTPERVKKLNTWLKKIAVA